MNATASPPLSPANTWPSATPIPTTPDVRAPALLGALAGLLALGGAAALGVPELQAAPRMVPSVLLVEIASLVLSSPALIALHQFMGLAAGPEALAAALGRALIHGGRVAAGLAVLVLFFSATTSLGTLMVVLSLGAVGVFTTATAWAELERAELAASPSQVRRSVAPRFTLLLLGWVGLGWVIALRVGVDVARWVVGF
ncbi:MAG: hypothetical protein KC431_29300 [Myxococcales bacterium]|nr:hypothetical protein [Myxococcales bacterium]